MKAIEPGGEGATRRGDGGNRRLESLLRMLVATASIVGSAASPCFAKCPFERYTFLGTVRNATDQAAIASASAILFIDSEETAFAEPGRDADGETGRTDERGKYRISSYFDTFSGHNIFTGDRCNGAPKRVTVVVSARGYETRRVTVTLHKVAREHVEAGHRIELPVIELALAAR